MKIKEYYDDHLKSGGKPLKIAYVASSDKIGSYEPGSEVARVVHLPTKLTANKDEALLWLGVESK